jgi:glycosyltransferase involved in cell wall biosynthesis
MRILLCHEFFYLRGGAERYLFDVMDLLIQHGHEVIPFSTHSQKNQQTPFEEFFVSHIDFPTFMGTRSPEDVKEVLARSIYSFEARSKLRHLLRTHMPDVAHVLGFAGYLSPSILDALREARIPVVQSLLDYRWLCPNTTFLSQGFICERCKYHHFHNVVLRRCKRGSLGASFLAGLQAYIMSFTGAANKVDIFLCHSRFLMDKMIEFSYPREKFRYAPHFLDLDRYPNWEDSQPFAVYFGRISPEKGVKTLLDAAALTGIPLKVIGEGPQAQFLRAYASEHNLDNVEFTGPKWGLEMQDLVGRARFVVCPSEWYENSPLVVYEAMAMGRPVVGARIGGIPELVQDHVTGLTFRAGDANDLADKMRFLMDHPECAHEWGGNARQQAGQHFSPQGHYETLMSVYQSTRDAG